MLFGALLLLVLLVVQASCYWFDQQVALDAGREGAAVAADTQAGGQDPQLVAAAFLTHGGWLMQNPHVSVHYNADHTVTVVVRAQVRSVLGSLLTGLPVRATVTVPVERFVGANG